MHFELLEVLTYHTMITLGNMNDGTSKRAFWHHLNFMARPITFHNTSSSLLPCTSKLFFAEVHNIPGGYFVSSCSIIDPNDPTAGNLTLAVVNYINGALNASLFLFWLYTALIYCYTWESSYMFVFAFFSAIFISWSIR